MKKKIILAIILVVILLGAGATYAYFATDLFKTDKQIFLSYILNNKMLEQFEDKAITDYVEKQENIAYTNKGEITLNASGLGEEVESVLNKTKVTIEGKNNTAQNKTEENITLDFSQGFNIPINFKNDGELYGIQSDFLDSKYITIRNENLRALLEKFDVDTEGMPDKIDFTQQTFTAEELEQLKEKYTTLLANNLEDELFTKSKIENQTVVTLSMTVAKFIDVLSKVLSEVRNDEIILSKLDNTQKQSLQEEIDKIIADFATIKTEETNKFEAKIYLKSRKVQNIECNAIENSKSVASIIIENVDNQFTIKLLDENTQVALITMTKQTAGNDVIYNVSIKVNSEGDEIQLDLALSYKNVLALDNVEEVIDVKLVANTTEIETDDEALEDSSIFVPTVPALGKDMELNIKYSNLKTFAPDLQIEPLNNDTAIILNDASEEELQTLLINIYQKLGLM